MIKHLLLSFLIIFFASISAQAQWFKWSESTGFSGQNLSQDVIVDGDNNLYQLGSFDDSLFMQNWHYRSVGSADLFITKYDTSGSELWIRHFGGSGLDAARSMAIDKSGNLVLAGTHQNNLYSYSWQDSLRGFPQNLFASRISAVGALVNLTRLAWAVGDAIVHDIAIDSKNNLYITGYFNDSIVFADSAYKSHGNWDIFICKFDSSSNLIWSKRCGGANSGSFGDYGYAIDLDSADNLYVAGIFKDTADFAGTRLISNNLSNDIFVLKFDTLGLLIWAKQFGDSRNDQCRDMLIDKNEIVLCGNFWSSLQMNNTVNSNGEYDIFLAKLDLDGTPKWIRSAGGPKWDDADRLCTDLLGNIYFTGYFNDTANFGGSTVQTAGSFEAYAARYDMNGNFQWVVPLAGNAYDRGHGIAVDQGQEVYLSGFFSDTLKLGTQTLVSSGGWDAYIARLSQGPRVGIEASGINPVKVYPNPSIGKITFDYAEIHSLESVQLYNSAGKLIDHFNASQLNKRQIEISEEPGLYILKFVFKDGSETLSRIVKMGE